MDSLNNTSQQNGRTQTKPSPTTTPNHRTRRCNTTTTTTTNMSSSSSLFNSHLKPSLNQLKILQNHHFKNNPKSTQFYYSEIQNLYLKKTFLDHISSNNLSKAVSQLSVLSKKGIRLKIKTLILLIKRIGNFKLINLGKIVHLHLKITGLKKPTCYLSNNLISMYLKCGDYVHAYKVFDEMKMRNLYTWNHMICGLTKLGKFHDHRKKLAMVKKARKLFDSMPERDVVSWNSMIIAYAKCGSLGEALRFYKEFRKSGIERNEYSFAGLLNVCVKVKELRFTRVVHGQVFVAGYLSNVVVSSSLLDAYAKCEEMGEARKLFDEMSVRDVLAWTTMVSGYAQKGDVEAAAAFFELMPVKNPVSWTSLISGYARRGLGYNALEVFTKMMQLRIPPDQFTFSSCLCACASIASLRHGKQIHGYLIRMKFRPNTIVVSSLIDMYSKCGCLNVGRIVFDLMDDKKDVVLWNTMISALAQHGYGREAIQIFDDMVKLGIKPTRITLVVILSACSHSGLVQEGLRLFESMTNDHSIIPDQEHYACLIDLLGRAGHFNTLMKQLQKMQCTPNDQIWSTLVGVCRTHGNAELGRIAAMQLIGLVPQSSAAYVLLSSTYAAQEKWGMVAKIRKLMNERGLLKEQALSWVEIENKVHAFTASDRSHPSKDVIYSVLDQLAGHIEEVS